MYHVEEEEAMLVTNGLEYLAVLALVNVGVTFFVKKFPSKIYKYVPPY